MGITVRDRISARGRFALPSIFFTNVSILTSADKRKIAENGTIKRGGIGAALASACRCSHGFVQVLLCRPIHKGRPFPTSFWLVCPHLISAAAAAEGEGGVRALGFALIGHEREYDEYQSLHAIVRVALMPQAQREYLRAHRLPYWDAVTKTGVGGSARRIGPPSVKCIHLHTASFMALRHHPAEDALKKMLGPLECDGSICGSSNK